MKNFENNENFKKLQEEFQNIRRFKNRLQKLMEMIPGVVEGITIEQLEKNQLNNRSNKRHSKRFFVPQEIKVKRSGIKYLSELTQLKKKSIERGISIFFEKNYRLYNTREYSREWMIFRKEKPIKRKGKVKNMNKQNIKKIKHRSLPTQNFSALKRKKRVISDTQSFNQFSSCEENNRNLSPKLQKTNSFNSLSDSYEINSNQNFSQNQSENENESEYQNENEIEKKKEKEKEKDKGYGFENEKKITNRSNFVNKIHENENNDQYSYYKHPKINNRPKSFSYYKTRYENQTTLNQMIFPKDQYLENNFLIEKPIVKKDNEKKKRKERERENEKEKEKEEEEEEEEEEERGAIDIENNNNKNNEELGKNMNNSNTYQRQQLKPFEPQTNLEDLYSSFRLYESDQMDEFQKRFYEITFNNSGTENQLMFDDNIHWSTLGDIWKSGNNDIFFDNN
ncbi:hypothetical protein M0813_26600 [Anaeramoeba flamelloides]|uniref:Uncharacterized protein n=1 Tax=Anaeramoeba flamelloides TaxID=1746091 RepID=A0ABQ8XYY0_9EUKA|nr:hypothetical protein M0813_26600 [Anaeramoeba flamelloides]